MLETVEEMLTQIAENNQSSSSLLTKRALECFVVFVNESQDTTNKALWHNLHQMACKLIQAQPDMAPLYSLSNTILSTVEHIMKQGGALDEIRHEIIAETRRFQQRLADAEEKMTAVGLNLIKQGETILTHSYSTSVKNLINSLHRIGQTIKVFVTESRPGYEGRQLARDLGRQGIHTTLIVDSAALSELDKIDKVIVGADRVTETFFVNKIGTLGIVLGAKHANRETYVLSDTTKFIHAGTTPLKRYWKKSILMFSLRTPISKKFLSP